MAEYYERVLYGEQPEAVRYRPRPNGKADVWIRHDIRQENDNEGGLIWVARELYIQTMQTEAEIVADAINIFLTKSGIQKRLTDAVQNWMDEKVHRDKDYDNIFTACSYANSTDAKFRAEGETCVAWRDQVWRYCYNALNAVKAGTRSIPTVDELLAELDTNIPLVWPEDA